MNAAPRGPVDVQSRHGATGLVPIALFLGRWAVGVLFLYAAWSKVFTTDAGTPGFELFAALARAHGVLPADWARTAAGAAVIAESVIGLLLMMPSASRVAGWAGLALLATFSGYLIWVNHVQGSVKCGCFGRIGDGTLTQRLIRNTVLTIGAGAWLLGPRSL